MKIYAIEYSHYTINGAETKLSMCAHRDLNNAIKEIEYRSNGSAVKDGSEFKWHWVDNGEHIYKIYELDVID